MWIQICVRGAIRGQAPPNFLSLFRCEFNKFYNIGAQMLDSIYHMTSK